MEYVSDLEELYKNVRQQNVENMQSSLKDIRNMLGLSMQSFGEYIGLSWQNVSSLESNQIKLNESQYLAICALIENRLKDNPCLWPEILQTLKFSGAISRSVAPLDQGSVISGYSDDLLENPSLLNAWFNSFLSTASEDEKLRLLLEKIVNADNKIFGDDSFLLMPGVDKVLEFLAPLLLAEHNQLFVPLVVIRKLKLNHQQTCLNGDTEQADCLDASIKALTMLKNRGLLAIRGESSDSDVEQTLVKVFTKFKSEHNMVLLSADEKMCLTIDALNETVTGPEIDIYIYKESAGLEQWGLASLEDQISSIEGWDSLDNSPQSDGSSGQDDIWK